MMGLIDEEDENIISLTGAMDLVIIESGEFAGMSMLPSIPFGINQSITIDKSDILFSVEPNEYIESVYLSKAEEATTILLKYVKDAEQRKIARDKNLH